MCKDIKKLNQNILTTIEPFNEFFFYTCFYSALFPILNHFNKSIMPILVNGVPIYKLWNTEENSGLFVEYEHIKDLKDLLAEEGIVANAKEKSANIVEDIIDALNSDKPVIIWVDCFYESIRSDLYQKEHWQHSLLIYGYNRQENMFYIIEHDNREDTSFNKKAIAFEDIANSYNGYLKHFHSEGVLSFFDFSIEREWRSKAEIQDCKVQYIQNLNVLDAKRLKGLEDLSEATGLFENIIKDEALLKRQCLQMINGFSDIIKAKAAVRYLIFRLFGADSEQLAYADKLLENWKMVRTIFAKYYYSNVYRLKSLSNAIDCLKNISCLENEFYESIMKHENP